MKQYRTSLILAFSIFLVTGCKSPTTTPASAGGEQVASQNPNGMPLKLNTSQQYTKHREVNRRMVHRPFRSRI